MDSPRTAASPPSATTTTVTYVIDTAGNLRSVTGGEHSVSYVYGDGNWADKLTGITVDNVSRTISYADAANPSNWFNGTDYTNLTWTQGRRLSSITKGSSTYSYEYDMSGIRTVKIADGMKHEYVTQNGRVVRETVYAYDSGTGEYSTFQYVLDFTYDESGHPLTMRKYNNADMQTNYITMHYVCNAQGDVVKLIYGGTVYAEYAYDAWGNVLKAEENGSYNYAALNPLRYRGYYFDVETGFYYLQSRYYDPIVKRFLNADSYGSTGQGFLGFNMFAYCNNDPVANEDPSGHYIGHQPIMVCDYSSKEIPPKIVSMEEAVRNVTQSAKYSQEAWDGLDFYGRWNLILEYKEEVENSMGLEHVNIEPFLPPVDDMSCDVGYYDHDSRTISINLSILTDRVTALDTVRHELRHYYQHTRCDELYEKYTGVVDSTVIKWERNFQDYIEDGPGYESQIVEKDANDWVARTR